MTAKETGYAMLVGGSRVGKTAVARVLDRINHGETPGSEFLDGIRPTNTLEYEYLTTSQELGGVDTTVTIQFLVPPGRIGREGDSPGRTFQDVIEIFKPTLHPLDVVLFTYDLTRRESFQELDFWIRGLQDLLRESTHFILLGTHLDQAGEREVTAQDIEGGVAGLAADIKAVLPGWKGNYAHLEVSNQTGENLETLIFYLAGSVVNAKKIQAALPKDPEEAEG